MPPPSLAEIRKLATAFAQNWADEKREAAEKQTFWNEFFAIFGQRRRDVATYEASVSLLADAKGAKPGFIDLFWPKVLIVEHKSKGMDLDSAFTQSAAYSARLKPEDRPRYIIVSDFARLRLYDLDQGTTEEIPLSDLPKQVELFGFIAGYQKKVLKTQDPVNVEAAERMGALHDRLSAIGFKDHPLRVMLVRLLFCLFAEDTGIFAKGQFADFITNRTSSDASDLAAKLAELFEILDTAPEDRLSIVDPHLSAFPYVNGLLFRERIRMAAFDSAMRDLLLNACDMDWSKISPAIFGAMFQSVMDATARRNLGAHYTAEENILKVIDDLFMDHLREEFNALKHDHRKLEAFHQRIGKLKFLDPACGCGNFLVITYREIRLLEIEILKALHGHKRKAHALMIEGHLRCDVDQFYGIEIEEFPAQIAQVALWLMDHQMNIEVSRTFGDYVIRIPLRATPHIHRENALRFDWKRVLPAKDCSFILGNPPFVGKPLRNAQQQADHAFATSSVKGAGVLDFVACWHIKALEYVKGTSIKVGFVSTNSICQGEQVGVLWGHLLAQGVHIHAAHRTFKWTSEAPGKATVHCIIVVWSLEEPSHPLIHYYDTPASTPYAVPASNISPYLLDAPNSMAMSRRKPICPVPPLIFGSMANDGGQLLLSLEEKDDLVSKCPAAGKWIRPFTGSEEYVNGSYRFCLWLDGITPSQLKAMPLVEARVKKVREHRAASDREATNELAATPYLFGERRQPKTDYIIIPRHTSEGRDYIPLGFQPPTIIAGDAASVIPDGDLYIFGVLMSRMHMAWMRTVAGRLESRYRYSTNVVYNNFPWPSSPAIKVLQAVRDAAQVVLDARSSSLAKGETLGDIYTAGAMPKDLVDAHRALDRIVDLAYVPDGWNSKNSGSDLERGSFLLRRLDAILSPSAPLKPQKGKR